MSGLTAIRLAIELATLRRDEVAKNVAKVSRSLSFSQDQLDQLQGYAGDTDARWMASATRVFSGELIRHHYQFMGRLQQAIALQQGVVSQVSEQVEQAKQALLKAEHRLAGLSQVLKARQDAQRIKQGRLEQRQTDEFAAMLHTRIKVKLLSEDTK